MDAWALAATALVLMGYAAISGRVCVRTPPYGLNRSQRFTVTITGKQSGHQESGEFIGLGTWPTAPWLST